MEDPKLTTQPVLFRDLKKHIEENLEKRLEYPYWDGFDKEWRPISREYEQPPKMPLHLYETAIKPGNRDKNRYGNALPPEKTRVILKTGKSDYINANWVDGDDGTKYIITQGPMEETFGDFWRMVWETNTHVIVMLTKEVENGRPKCGHYWDKKNKTPLEVEEFAISTEKKEKKDEGELTIRTFKLKNTKSNEERTVFQYQYAAWPDQGIPPTFDSFLEIVEESDKKKEDGPIVVHCSAGLGRSGAFAMVHSSLKKLEQDLKKDPKANPEFHMEALVFKMRKQRHGLIQTGKQFEFVYRAIAEGSEKIFKKYQNTD